MQMLTFLPLSEVAAIEESMRAPGYVPNTAQRRLAEEVTRFVHGDEGLAQALKTTEVRHELGELWLCALSCRVRLPLTNRHLPHWCSRLRAQALRPGASTALDAATLEAVAGDAPSATLASAQVAGVTVAELLVTVKLQPSKGAARK